MPPRSPAENRALLEELARLYAEADALFAGWSCPASTDCCRFAVTGREPYVTSVELAALERAVAARGGPRSWKPAAPVAGDATAKPGRRSLPLARADRICPMLDASGRCAVYAARPFGCRTFFCDRAESGSPAPRKAVAALVRRLQDLAALHASGGEKGRPLTGALAASGRPGRP